MLLETDAPLLRSMMRKALRNDSGDGRGPDARYVRLEAQPDRLVLQDCDGTNSPEGRVPARVRRLGTSVVQARDLDAALVGLQGECTLEGNTGSLVVKAIGRRVTLIAESGEKWARSGPARSSDNGTNPRIPETP
jgi:hypothetical protein